MLLLVCASVASACAQTNAIPDFSPAATRGAVSLIDVAAEIEAPPPGALPSPVHPAHAVFRFRLIGQRHEGRYVIYGRRLIGEIVLRYRLGAAAYEVRDGTDVASRSSDVPGLPVAVTIPEAAWDAPYVDVAVEYAYGTSLPKIDLLHRLTAFVLDEQTTSFAFIGFFIAIGLFSAILSIMLRDASFTWYALAIGLFAAFTLTADVPHAWRHTLLQEALVESLLASAYFMVVAQFAGVFLTLNRVSRRLYITFLVLAALNGVGIVAESCLQDAWPFFIVDEIVGYGLPIALLIGGITMARRGMNGARFYIVAFTGVVVGLIVKDLDYNGIVPGGAFLVDYSLEIGVAFEALFLALALADRTHRVDRERQRLEALVDIDALTGLANRRRFDDALRRDWLRNAGTGKSLAMLMIDVDWFKNYNDRYGHPAGDDVLRRIAAALLAAIPGSDNTAARYGGEEFALILGETNVREAALLAERCRRAVESLAISHQGSAAGVVTISIGVAVTVPVSGGSPMTLIIESDAALYRAKAAGRNHVVTSASDQPHEGDVCGTNIAR